MKKRGVSLTKFGEVLGSRGCQQAKIDRANRFLKGEQKSISFDEMKKVAKFFERPTNYFLPLGELREERAKYGRMTSIRIDKMSAREVDETFAEIAREQSNIFRGVQKMKLSESVKRTFLKAFYFSA